MSRGARAALALALAVLACAPLCAAEAAQPGGAADLGAMLLSALARQLDLFPRWSGAVLVLLGMFPLLLGWKLIRWSMALTCAGIALGAVLAQTLAAWGPALAWTAALALTVICGLAGFFLYQAAVALQGALAGAALLTALAGQLAGGHDGLILAAGILGALIGGLIGWKLAPLLGIIETVVLGSLVVLDGMSLVVGVESATELRMLTALVLPITLLPGFIVQLRALRRGD